MPVRFPAPVGFVAPGFERVLSVFKDSFAKGIDKGASFAAYYKGKPVLHLWGGLADEQAKRPWKEDTMGFFHSTTKFVASVTVALMVERGLLRYEEKICRYWPDFAQNGKENITLEMLLSYRAGLPALSDNFQLSLMKHDPDKMLDLLVKQKPFWTPGTAHGYSPITIGIYLNEIVRRVDKRRRNLSQYFHDEIAVPFGIDFYIGVPKPLQHRACRLEPLSLDKELINKVFANFKGDLNMYQTAFTQPKDWNATHRLNDPDFMELPNPASHGCGTALAMAKLSGIVANEGDYEGKSLLSPDSIRRLQEPMSHGIDLVTSGTNISGRGTWLIPVVEGNRTWFMFGHAGYGDQCSACDPHYKVGWSYVTNYIDPSVYFNGKQNKWRPLITALFECIHDLEGVQVQRRLLDTYEELEKEKNSLKQTSKL